MNDMSGKDSCGSDDISEDDSLDSFEELKEIESRFYSVIHYNNLSETVPSDLPEGFRIDINDSNEVTVMLATDYNLSNIISADNHIPTSQLETSKSYDCNESGALSDKELDFNSKEKNENLSLECTKKSSESLYQLNCKEKYVQNIGEQKHDDDVIIIGTFPVSDSATQRDSSKSHSINSKKRHLKMDLEDKRDSVATNCIPIPDPSTRSEGTILHNSVTQTPALLDNSDIITNISTFMKEKQTEDILISSDDTVNREKHSSEKNKVDRKRKRKFDKDKHCPKKWTMSMIKYYSKISRKKLNFDSSKLINKMRATGGRKGWFLNEKDITGRLMKRQRRRCPRCRQFDHDVKYCTEPVKPITCYMCGEIGHRENRCPHKKCFTCGNPNPVYIGMCSACVQNAWKGNFVCRICNSNQHEEELCPEVWRSFLFTTKEGSLVIPLSENNTRKICCNCGRSGHFDYDCTEMTNSVYTKSKPNVRNYFAVAEILARDKENFKINIKMNSEEGRVISSDDGFKFLQNLSNKIKARLELDNCILTVQGSRTQCEAVFDQLSFFVQTELPNLSFHKHKKKTPPKTRRTI